MHHFSLKSWVKITVTVILISLIVIFLITDSAVFVKFSVLHKPGNWNRQHESQRRILAKSFQATVSTSSTFGQHLYNFTQHPPGQRAFPEQTFQKTSSVFEHQPQNQESINTARVMAAREYCKTLDQKIFFYKNQKTQKITPRHFGHLYVNDEYKFIHCNIPKIACTNWKRLFLGLAGVKTPFLISARNVHEYGTSFYRKMDKMRLSNFSPTGIAYRLQHYTKAIVVRDPMERILSAFRNKLNFPGNEYFLKKYGAKILQKYHPDLPPDVIEQGAGVTFLDFVQYITHPMDFPNLKPWNHMNEHWERYFALCHPCFVRYNIIAKYETLDDDVNFIMEKIGASDVIKWPKRRQHYSHTPTSKLVSDAFQNISSDDLRTLSTLYYDDHKMFGYEFQNNGDGNASLLSV
ncbi:carbohydrate sulfotransferase 11-like [Lineus longissimus]|uniref:carbohydrate sulfotransferase 11-like n=1 Tax=Lineus longissimus TaxID=88925 RepID=UPI002B4C849A